MESIVKFSSSVWVNIITEFMTNNKFDYQKLIFFESTKLLISIMLTNVARKVPTRNLRIQLYICILYVMLKNVIAAVYKTLFPDEYIPPKDVKLYLEKMVPIISDINILLNQILTAKDGKIDSLIKDKENEIEKNILKIVTTFSPEYIGQTNWSFIENEYITDKPTIDYNAILRQLLEYKSESTTPIFFDLIDDLHSTRKVMKSVLDQYQIPENTLELKFDISYNTDDAVYATAYKRIVTMISEKEKEEVDRLLKMPKYKSYDNIFDAARAMREELLVNK